MKNLVLLLLCLVPYTAYGQYGKDTGYWEFVENQYTPAVVRLQVFFEDNSFCGGTGFVIWKSDKEEDTHPTYNSITKGYILTAEHVMKHGNLEAKAILVSFQNSNTFFTDKINMSNGSQRLGAMADICVFDAYVSKDQAILKIATEASRGDEVWVCGYGGKAADVTIKDIRCFKDKIKHVSKDKDCVMLSHEWGVIQGDSGGPGYNARGEVVFLISGGAMWVQDDKLDVLITNPIMGPSYAAINKLIECHKTPFKQELPLDPFQPLPPTIIQIQ